VTLKNKKEKFKVGAGTREKWRGDNWNSPGVFNKFMLIVLVSILKTLQKIERSRDISDHSSASNGRVETRSGGLGIPKMTMSQFASMMRDNLKQIRQYSNTALLEIVSSAP
jgi:hypothetical protein